MVARGRRLAAYAAQSLLAFGALAQNLHLARDCRQTVDRSNAVALAEQWRAVYPGAQSVDKNGKNARQVWTDASGEPVIEVNMITGMGHGTPLDGNRLGSPGPFMLDVGISSTHEIARFWKIADPNTSATARPASETVTAAAPAHASGADVRAHQ